MNMNNLDIKQIIVVRNDLRSKLRHGKLAAQVSHASMAAFLKGMQIVPSEDYYMSHQLKLEMDKYRYEWITGSFTKVVVRCEDEKEIMALYERCQRHESIPHALIVDSGRTVFSEPTTTCLGIGPLPQSILGPLTGHLKLY